MIPGSRRTGIRGVICINWECIGCSVETEREDNVPSFGFESVQFTELAPVSRLSPPGSQVGPKSRSVLETRDELVSDGPVQCSPLPRCPSDRGKLGVVYSVNHLIAGSFSVLVLFLVLCLYSYFLYR